MGPIGIPELLIVLLIAVLIFGAARLPEIGRGLGQAITNFRSSLKDNKKEEPESLGNSAKEKEVRSQK